MMHRPRGNRSGLISDYASLNGQTARNPARCNKCTPSSSGERPLKGGSGCHCKRPSEAVVARPNKRPALGTMTNRVALEIEPPVAPTSEAVLAPTEAVLDPSKRTSAQASNTTPSCATVAPAVLGTASRALSPPMTDPTSSSPPAPDRSIPEERNGISMPMHSIHSNTEGDAVDLRSTVSIRDPLHDESDTESETRTAESAARTIERRAKKPWDPKGKRTEDRDRFQSALKCRIAFKSLPKLESKKLISERINDNYWKIQHRLAKLSKETGTMAFLALSRTETTTKTSVGQLDYLFFSESFYEENQTDQRLADKRFTDHITKAWTESMQARREANLAERHRLVEDYNLIRKKNDALARSMERAAAISSQKIAELQEQLAQMRQQSSALGLGPEV